MDIGLIRRVAGVGILVTVINQVLSKSGRDEHAMLVSIAGVVLIMLMIVQQISDLFNTVMRLFGL